MALIPAALFIISACLPVSDTRDLSEIDFQPPVLDTFEVISDTELRFNFNKPACLVAESLTITPYLEISSIEDGTTTMLLTLSSPQKEGTEYIIEMMAEDERHNTLNLCIPFYGYNPRVPGLLINEFTTQGSSSHPDIVELFALSSGSLAGVTLYEGLAEDWEQKMVLPACEIDEGDFILVHFKPQGIPEEINETEDTSLSGGLDASPDAFDFWVDFGSGLSGNNGVITLCSNPMGSMIDAVLYSNRTSMSDEKYRGFGSVRVMERADLLAETGSWVYSGEAIAPEDGINPEESTATRSMCRDSVSSDSNSKDDWHIVPTSTSSFGSANSDDIYLP